MAPLIWEALGDVPNFVEPFAGSLAVLLGRPHPPRVETVNDKDAFICNVWRAIAADPKAVAQHAHYPVSEPDLHARHVWLRAQREQLTRRLEGDPAYYDAKIAGWWLWGISCWIGGGWCDPNRTGPWDVREDAEGYQQLVHLGSAGQGVRKQRVHLGDTGRGVSKKRVHLGDTGQGVTKGLVHLGDTGRGVSKRLVHLGDAEGLYQWMEALCRRLDRVRVTCGDWQRILGPSVTTKHGMTGVLLDPPYAQTDREVVYSIDDDCSQEVMAWAIANGDNPLMRIILCGYEQTCVMPPSWRVVAWKTQGGYAGQGNGRGKDNVTRERLWLSPHCLAPSLQGELW